MDACGGAARPIAAASLTDRPHAQTRVRPGRAQAI